MPKASSTSAGAGSKRKAASPSKNETSIKKPRKSKARPTDQSGWPEYFKSLYKVYKSLNTILAFCSSRKHLATTFDSIRASVEASIKEPLDLDKVAEIKALLPDLVDFAYTPQNARRIHASEEPHRSCQPDYSQFGPSTASEAEDHVLVLEFLNAPRGNQTEDYGPGYAFPPALSPAAMKKLIEKRNIKFEIAVTELLDATSDNEDPVALLKDAGHDSLPVNPNWSNADSDPKEVPSSTDRPNVDAVIEEMKIQGWYKDQIVMNKVKEELKARDGLLQNAISGAIWEALRLSRSISSFYSHQTEAINALDAGKHVIVSTSTASGKSVIYQVPMLKFLEEDDSATAMFIYPTKALAQDQRTSVEELIGACAGLRHIQVATYDGDTPQEKRREIRDNASVIFTNFDMIHTSILPHEELWRRFLKNLKLVAVDELHYYTDMFGSHVAQIIRRFRRICAAVGNRRVLFVSCSATISKPSEHMRAIFGINDVQVVTEDGAPSGRKHFLVWKPPLKDPKDPELGRMSPIAEATGLMRFLMKRGIRVILFCKIRKVCEMAMKNMRTEMAAEGRLDILERVMSYRGGYSAQDRRKIEHEAFSGNLLGIIATNALELGVDIGVLDAVIILGFPLGGFASLQQQAGRAGRRARDSLAVYIAESAPVDRIGEHYPDPFDQPAEELIVDLENIVLLEAHLQCAATEMPVTLADEEYFGPLTKEVCQTRLAKDKDGWYHTHPKFMPYPAKHVSIRGIQEECYTLIDITRFNQGGVAKILEEVEVSRALFEVYEGGVFIHQGLTFVIKEVSHDARVARLIRADVNWTTEPRDFTNVDALQTFRIREIKSLEESAATEHSFYGRIRVCTTVYGYTKIRNGKKLDKVDIEAPPWEMETMGFWIDLPKITLPVLLSKEINAAAAIHSASHAILNRFSMARDLKTDCVAPEDQARYVKLERKRPARLIFYDIPGKSGGVASKAFDRVSELVRSAYNMVISCPCDIGCSKCIESASCKEFNAVSSKSGAELVLQAALGRLLELDPVDAEYNQYLDSIVEAIAVPSSAQVEVEKD